MAPPLLRVWRNQDLDRSFRAVGTRLASLAERWGPAATKVAQLAASRRDLFPGPLLQPLERVQDRVRLPSQFSLRRALIRAYGAPSAWPFEIVSLEPIAAGSIAVVLHARAANGTPLAIKLVRNGVARQVSADLQCLAWLMRKLERHPRFNHLPLSGALGEIAKSVELQCDMLREAESYARLEPSFGPGIASPKPHMKICRPTALAMDLRIAEYKLNDPRLPADVYRSNCRSLLHALYRMIFVNGFVHCDLHPGNVATDGKGGLILYDLGLTAELSPRDCNILAGLFDAIGSANSTNLAMEMVAAASMVPAHLNRDDLQADARIIIDRWSGSTSGDFLVAGLASDLFELQKRHGIRSRPSFVAAIWALATYEGLVRDSYPDLDFQLEARPFLTSSLIARLRPRYAACA